MSHRRAHTTRKSIRLTHQSRAAIQSWADAQGISFSAAIDSLAQIGLGTAPSEALAPALVSVVRTEVQRQTHRLASLLAASAIDAGMATRLAGALLRSLRPGDYEAVKRAARIDTIQALRRRSALLQLTEGDDGDRQGQLPTAR
jgi:hypothetical protein